MTVTRFATKQILAGDVRAGDHVCLEAVPPRIGPRTSADWHSLASLDRSWFEVEAVDYWHLDTEDGDVQYRLAYPQPETEPDRQADPSLVGELVRLELYEGDTRDAEPVYSDFLDRRFSNVWIVQPL